MSSTNKGKDLAEDAPLIVEEKIVKVGGETTIKKYSKGRFLGKVGDVKNKYRVALPVVTNFKIWRPRGFAQPK